MTIKNLKNQLNINKTHKQNKTDKNIIIKLNITEKKIKKIISEKILVSSIENQDIMQKLTDWRN